MDSYDATLAGIAFSLAAGLTAPSAVNIPLPMSAAVGGLIGAGFMYYGMFYNEPVTDAHAATQPA